MLGSTLTVLVTVKIVSVASWPAEVTVSWGKSIVFVKKPCSACKAVSEVSMEVSPNKGAVPAGNKRVIIPAKDLRARSCVNRLELKIPVLIVVLSYFIKKGGNVKAKKTEED
jgi:hypothetical protein